MPRRKSCRTDGDIGFTKGVPEIIEDNEGGNMICDTTVQTKNKKMHKNITRYYFLVSVAWFFSAKEKRYEINSAS